MKKFTFHNYRNTALTRWARQGINVDVAMRASGHSSVQMHKRYGDLQREDIAKAFSVELEMATEIATEQRTANRKYFKSLLEKEGARWCRWSSKTVCLTQTTRDRTGRLAKSHFFRFFISSFHILSHFADNHLSRLILGENWQQGGYMETARETRIRAAD